MYNKLFSKIVTSSIWLEPTPTRMIWITFLAIMDEDGFAPFASVANLAHTARIELQDAIDAVHILESPDENSGDKDHEGRRIERVPGGWMVLNAKKYRDIVTRVVAREKTRERVKRFRERKTGNADVTVANVRVTQSETDTYTEANKNAPVVLGLNTEAWEAWESYRRGIRKPLREVSIQSAMKKLAAFGDDQLAVVEQSKANGWTGLFPLPVASKRISAASVFPDARAAIHDPSLRKKFPPDSRVFKAVQLLGGWQEFGNRSPKFIEKEFCDAYERTA